MVENGVFVSSRSSNPARSAMWRRIRSEGFPIISSWIDKDGSGKTINTRDLWADIQVEILLSCGLVLYVEPGDFPLRGSLVEAGMALASLLPVVVVAPGVSIDPESFDPIGSWMNNAIVSTAPTVELAIDRLVAWRN